MSEFTERLHFLGERLKSARKEKGMTQHQLAQATLFADSTISGIENGKIQPTERAIRLLSQVLGKKAAYFTDVNYIESSKSEDISTSSDEATQNYEPENEPGAAVEVCRLLVQSGQYEQALSQLSDLDYAIFKPPLRLRASFTQAQALNRIKPPQTVQARSILQNLLNEITAKPVEPPAPGLAEIRYEIGNSYVFDQQLKVAIEQYEIGLQVLGEAADRDRLGFLIYTELGRTWRRLDDLRLAAHYYEKAHLHNYGAKDDRVMANLLLSQGMALVEQKRYIEAQEKLSRSQQLYEKLSQSSQASAVASYLDVVYAQLKEFDKIDLNKTQLTSIENSTATNELIVMSNRATVLRLKGDLVEAQTLLERTLQFMQAKQEEINPEKFSHIHLEAANLAVELEQPDQSITHFTLALLALRTNQARWSEFESVYEAYEAALLKWGRKSEHFDMSLQRQQDKKDFS